MSDPCVLNYDRSVNWGRAKVVYRRSLRAFLLVLSVAISIGLFARSPGSVALRWMLSWVVVIVGAGACATYARTCERQLVDDLKEHFGDGSDLHGSNCFVEVHLMVDGVDMGYDRGVLFDHQSSLVFNGLSNSFVLGRCSLVPLKERKKGYHLKNETQEVLRWIPLPLMSSKESVWLGIVPLAETTFELGKANRRLVDMLTEFENVNPNTKSLTSFNPPVLAPSLQRAIQSSKH